MTDEASVKVEGHIESVIAAWRNNRLLFPGWIILPHQNRQITWRNTRYWIYPVLNAAAEASPASAIDFLYELVWRLDRCLLPLFDDLAASVHKAASSGLEVLRQPKTMGSKHPSIKSLRYLLSSLLRYYRESNRDDQFDFVANCLALPLLQSAQSDTFVLHQRALRGLERNNFAEVEALVATRWPDGDPIWSARQAAILSEIGRPERAQELALEALRETRKIEFESTVVELNELEAPGGLKVAAASREGIALKLLEAVDFTLRFAKGTWSAAGQRERWDQLTAYRANITLEYQMAEMDARQKLSDLRFADDVLAKPASRRHSFSFNENDNPIEKMRPSLVLVRFLEEAAFPVSIGITSVARPALKTAIDGLSILMPDFAIRLLPRLTDADASKKLLTLDRIAALPAGTLAHLYDTCLQVCSRWIQKVGMPSSSVGSFDPNGEATRAAIACIDAIAARLTTRQKIEVVLAAHAILALPTDRSRWNVQLKAAEVVRTIAVWTRSDEIDELAEPILTTPVSDNQQLVPEAVTSAIIKLMYRWPASPKSVPNWELHANSWLNLVVAGDPNSEASKLAWFRLAVLYSNDLMPSNVIIKLREILWQRTSSDSLRWPRKFSTFLLVHLPRPPQDELRHAFCAYVESLPIQSMRTSDGNGWQFRSFGVGDLVATILSATGRPWRKESQDGDVAITLDDAAAASSSEKLIKWWEEEGRLIAAEMPTAHFASIFYGRLESVLNVIAYALPSTEIPGTRRKIAEGVAKIVIEAGQMDVPVAHALPAIMVDNPSEISDEMEAMIRGALGKRDADHVGAGVESVLHWIALSELGVLPNPPLALVASMGHIIRLRKQPGLRETLSKAAILIASYPEYRLQILEDLLIGLEHLLGEANYESRTYLSGPTEDWVIEVLSTRIVIKRILPSLQAAIVEDGLINKKWAERVIASWEELLAADPFLGNQIQDKSS